MSESKLIKLSLVLKIQKNFLLKKILAYHKSHKMTTLLSNLNDYVNRKQDKYTSLFSGEIDQLVKLEQQYSALQKFIINKDIKKIVFDWLALFHRFKRFENFDGIVKMNENKFLISWMIVSFPEFVLGKKQEILEKSILDGKTVDFPDDIYLISKKFINAVSVTNIDLKSFVKIADQYLSALNYFLERDKITEIQKCVGEYHQMNLTKSMISKSEKHEDSEKQTMIQSISKTQNKIIAFIQKLDKTIGKNEIELFSALATIEMNQMKNEKYKILLDDIESKKLIYFRIVIDELKMFLLKLGGNKTKSGFNLEEVLDSDFIARMISHGLEKFSVEDVNRYGNYIVSIINELEAPVTVVDTNEKWDRMKFDCVEKNISSASHLTKMLFFSFDKLMEINDSIQSLGTMIDMGMNIFSLE